MLLWLTDEAGLDVGRDDAIETGNRGYRFTDPITLTWR